MNREKVIRRLLDGLAQLLTRDPLDKTACSIHLPADCTDEVTLAIVRRHPLSTTDRSELTKVLSDISDFVTRSPPARQFLPRNIGVGIVAPARRNGTTDLLRPNMALVSINRRIQ
jgi:hypothetical protein